MFLEQFRWKWILCREEMRNCDRVKATNCDKSCVKAKATIVKVNNFSLGLDLGCAVFLPEILFESPAFVSIKPCSSGTTLTCELKMELS